MYYFDWTSTSPVSKSALEEYSRASLSYPGNPSSTHPMGVQASGFLEDCRKRIAGVLEVKPSELYFTSGGTESDNIVLQSLLNIPSPGEIVTTGIEHAAVLENRAVLEEHGWKFTVLNCPGGYLDPDSLSKALNPRVKMVCIMAVNNVTGTIQDLKALACVVRNYEKQIGKKIHIHSDAVQALGKFIFRPNDYDLNSAAFSAHKFCGPRGTGLLWCRNSAIRALSKGGSQEHGMRGGTENVPAIGAMTKALEDAVPAVNANLEKVKAYRNMVEEAVGDAGYTLLSPSSESSLAYSPYIITISVDKLPSEVFLRIMADRGFCLSAGSACSTNSRGKAERVLQAMGFSPKQRMSAVRISLSSLNTQEEVELLCKTLKDVSKEY